MENTKLFRGIPNIMPEDIKAYNDNFEEKVVHWGNEATKLQMAAGAINKLNTPDTISSDDVIKAISNIDERFYTFHPNTTEFTDNYVIQLAIEFSKYADIPVEDLLSGEVRLLEKYKDRSGRSD